MNDQQYATMEAFRRALQQAATHQGANAETAGASVSYFLVQDRRHLDILAPFGKGHTQSFNGDAHVFWAAPTEDYHNIHNNKRCTGYSCESKDKQLVKINEDMEKETSFPTEFDVVTGTNLSFTENAKRQESDTEIINSKASTQAETVFTSAAGVSATQSYYRDFEGQHGYASNASGSVTRETTWSTPHPSNN
jgi:hypothetical protein